MQRFRNSYAFVRLAACTTVSALALATPAWAQVDQTDTDTSAQNPRNTGSVLTGDIVVTAQRRSENVQDVPISISAVSGEQLKALNIQDAQRIVDFVPNFKASGLGGAGGPPVFNIRGISFVDFSNINEASVALYVDEVYQVAQGAGTQQVFDLDRVEVLRGPQGTLFGRNSTAGVVHYITRKPTDTFEGSLSAQYGSYDQVVLQMAAGGPVTEGLRARFALKYNRDDGWQKDPRNGNRYASTDAIAARGIVQADLGPAIEFEGNIHYSRNNGQSPVQRPYFLLDPSNPSGYCGGRPVPGTPADIAHAQCVLAGNGVSRTAGQAFDNYRATRGITDREEWPFAYRSWGGYGKITADLGFAELVSISGYETYDQEFTYDGDGYDNRPYGSGSGDLRIFFNSQSETFSQEVRLSGDSGPVDWVVGGFYYDGEQNAQSTISVDNFKTDLIGFTTHTKSVAGFGQADVAITDALTLTGGLRYTSDKRRMDPLDCSQSNTSPICEPIRVPKIKDNEWTYRLAANYELSPDLLLYAAYSHGFKSGGWNTGRAEDRRGPVGSEKVDNYEIGFKSQFFDRRVTFNTALFYYKFRGLQALIGATDPATGASQVLYVNAGDPRTYGAEFELSAQVFDGFEVRLGGGYLDTKIKADPSFSADGRVLNGNRLPQAPEFSGNAIVRYTFDLGASGAVTLQGDGRYQTYVYSGVDNDPAERVDGYGIANARIQWRSDSTGLGLEAFVDNVFDKQVIQQIFHPTLGSFPQTPTGSSPLFDSGFGVWGRPRTWGVRASYDF